MATTALTAVVGAFAQRGAPDRQIASLTVPADRLPGSCILDPDHRLGFTSNPWSGSDRRLAGIVRDAVDGTPPLPDGPLPNDGERAAFDRQWVEHVVDAYRAVYKAYPAKDVTDATAIEVDAVTFDSPARAAVRPVGGAGRSRGIESRVVLGSTVAVVRADASNTCFEAITGYRRSLR